LGHGTGSDVGLARDVVAGAIAGALGTVAMSGLMLAGQRLGLLGEAPPRKMSDAVMDRMPGHVDEASRQASATLLHLTIGAVAGSGLQLIRRFSGHRKPDLAWGAGAGAGLWAVNYVLIAPASGLMAPPQRDRPGRPIVMFLSHLVWGVVSSVLGDRLAGLGIARDGIAAQSSETSRHEAIPVAA